MNERGFTLVELLIVCAIIGILAALAISNYSLFKGNAFIAMTASDARNLAPAADFASSKMSGTDTIPLLESVGGPVDPRIPGGTKSAGTYGTVFLAPNYYRIETYHPVGDVCFTFDSDIGMTMSQGGC